MPHSFRQRLVTIDASHVCEVETAGLLTRSLTGCKYLFVFLIVRARRRERKLKASVDEVKSRLGRPVLWLPVRFRGVGVSIHAPHSIKLARHVDHKRDPRLNASADQERNDENAGLGTKI